MKLINLAIVTLSTVSMTLISVSAKQTTTATYIYETDDGTKSETRATQVVTTEKIPDDVILKMLDDKIDSYPGLAVHNGMVILKGTVDNLAERDHAGVIAKSIPGVTEVDNLLFIENRE